MKYNLILTITGLLAYELLEPDLRKVDRQRSTIRLSQKEGKVLVEIEAEDLGTGERRQAMMAHYIMVATDSKGKPVAVPPLIVITEDEERLFSEGLARYQAIKETSDK